MLTYIQYDVVFEFTCNFGEYKSLRNSYISITTRTEAERLYEHSYKGFIYKHFMEVHGYRPKLDEILKSSTILYRVQNRKDIHVFEALHIYAKKPIFNDSISDFEILF